MHFLNRTSFKINGKVVFCSTTTSFHIPTLQSIYLYTYMSWDNTAYSDFPGSDYYLPTKGGIYLTSSIYYVYLVTKFIIGPRLSHSQNVFYLPVPLQFGFKSKSQVKSTIPNCMFVEKGNSNRRHTTQHTGFELFTFPLHFALIHFSNVSDI